MAVVLAIVSACSAERKTPDQVFDLLKHEAGETGEIVEQPVTVKRENGDRDRITLYIVTGPDDSKVVFDSTGERYEPTLDDFRANNDLLSSDDIMILPRDFPNTPPLGHPGSHRPLQLIEVSGHTDTTWVWWLGSGAVVVACGLAFWLWKRRRRVEGEPD